MRWLLLALVGCSGGKAGDAEPSGSGGLEPVTSVELVLPDQQLGRPMRRMNIDQLASAIQVTTGQQWEEEGVLLLEQLSGSLGKPDFLDSTSEDLAPGLLFQKFLDDAAKHSCNKLLDEEATAGLEDRRFTVGIDLLRPPSEDEAATTAALTNALLLFHGKQAQPDEVAVWRWLLDGAYDTTGSSLVSWRAVCVGLITHPDFYSY